MYFSLRKQWPPLSCLHAEYLRTVWMIHKYRNSHKNVLLEWKKQNNIFVGGIKNPRWDMEIPTRIPGRMHKSRLNSRVGCRNPALNVASQVGSNFHLKWERWDPTTWGGIPPFPPGILGGIAEIPPISRLTFYLGF